MRGEAGRQKGGGEEDGSTDEKGNLAEEARGNAVRAKRGEEGSGKKRSEAAGEPKRDLQEQDCWFWNSKILSSQGKQKKGKEKRGG